MNKPLVLSMDLAVNSKHAYLLKDGPERTLLSGSVSSSNEKLEQLLEEIPDRQDRDLVVVMEATGMAWFPVTLFFKSRDIPVYRVKAQQSEEFRKFLSRHAKTDQLDADALARLYYSIPDQLHKVWLPTGNLQNLRRWMQRREDYMQSFSADKNRLQTLLKWTLPSLKGKMKRFTGKKMREIMAKAVDYRWVCTHMGKQRFIDWAMDRNRSLSRQKLEELFNIVQQARQLYEDTDYDARARSEEAMEIVEHLHYLDEKIENIEKKMKKQYRKVLSEKPVETVPGVAWKTGAAAKSYLGDGSRFSNLSKAEAFVGAIPETDQSGDRDRQGTSIRKDGPALLKKFLYMAANTARQLDPQIAKTYHDQMVNKGKVHTQALCKCMNKVLSRILRVLDDGEEYQLRDNDENPVEKKQARRIIDKKYTVPEKIRRQRRTHTT